MKNGKIIIIGLIILMFSSCRQIIEKEETNYKYYDIDKSDTLTKPSLFAITDDGLLEMGKSVAYINEVNDTIIPFGKYFYCGTDTLIHYANVMCDGYDRKIGIDRKQNILFDVVFFDYAPDPFNDGLTRVLRNGKMGYADIYGRIIIPCKYDYAYWFNDGLAEVTYDATEFIDLEEHHRVESDEWFTIDLKGKKIINAP